MPWTAGETIVVGDSSRVINVDFYLEVGKVPKDCGYVGKEVPDGVVRDQVECNLTDNKKFC